MSSVRARVFRDPIHGDISVGALQSAIVDTTLFQRLRFIRQNGLLHYVFPGAIHTRFIHSLGTMHIAQRVFCNLFPEFSVQRCHANKSDGSALAYVGSVFEVAALLHDLGHCAFSHSIENVRIRGRPLLPSVDVLATAWAKEAKDLKGWLAGAKKAGYQPPDITHHEEVGLLMVGVLFGGYYPQVAETCRQFLGVEPSTFSGDVIAVLKADPAFSPSTRFRECAAELVGAIAGGSDIPEARRASDLIAVLHPLISGTLDVDRLDYLIRDSHFVGVPYGLCDVEVLVNAIQLGVVVQQGVGPSLVPALRARATHALDDMLWSRYQLFSQVLNHKTNVMLNALLADAIPEALDDSAVDLKAPKAFVDFIEFTDDYVMSRVMRACLRGSGADTAYDRALVHRDLPFYIDKLELSGSVDADERAIGKRRLVHAKRYLNSTRLDDIRTWRVESSLIKGGGLPYVVTHDRQSRKPILTAPGEKGAFQILDWTRNGKMPVKVESCHFFVDRQKIGGSTKKGV